MTPLEGFFKPDEGFLERKLQIEGVRRKMQRSKTKVLYDVLRVGPHMPNDNLSAMVRPRL